MSSSDASVGSASTGIESRRGRAARRWRRIRRKSIPFLFLTPFLVGFVIFMVVPLVYALGLSLFRSKIIGGRTFVGIENYIKALQDPIFWSGVRHVLTFGLIQIPVMLGIALVAALILDAAVTRWRTIFRLGFFVPFAVPAVVAALIWGYLYGQSFGPIAQIAHWLGQAPPIFLTQGTIIVALANISTWQYTGYNMLIMYAALKSIPPELYEAARVDGATGIQIARFIRIPLIFPAIILTFIFSIIGTLQLFTEPQIMNVIAPSAVGPNFTPNIYVYTLSFMNRQFDYAAAIAFTLAVVTAAVASVVLYVSRRRGGLA